MNLNKQNTGLCRAITLSLGLLGASSLMAAEPPVTATAKMPPMQAQAMQAAPVQAMMQKHHDKMAADLKLDEKQRKLFDAVQEQMKDRMDHGKDLHRQIGEMVHSENYDEKNVREVIRKHNTEMEDNMVAAANAMHAFYQSLSPEQKEKLKSMQENRHENMRDNMKAMMKDKMAAHINAGDAPAVKDAGHHSHEQAAPVQ